MTINWIPVTEKMPEPEKPVLICHGTTWSRATWIPKHHTEDRWGEYEGDLDWTEDGEHAYWPEGWYEWNNVEEIHWMIESDKPVTHWAEVTLPSQEGLP